MVDSEYNPDNYKTLKNKYWNNDKKSRNAKILLFITLKPKISVKMQVIYCPL